jgi:hypothetical protein
VNPTIGYFDERPRRRPSRTAKVRLQHPRCPYGLKCSNAAAPPRINAKDDLARDGSVMNTHVLLKRNGQKVCVADVGVKDAMTRTLKAVAPACKAVGSTFEAWIAPEHVVVRPSAHPNRAEAIVVSVQSKEGSWFVTATFDRDGDGKPRSPSAPVMCWNTKFEGRCVNLYT